uniref:Uncharacterized protein n=1 Tax=Tetranychus urticae TaxID=32264 RepID=T1KAX5_TETUR
MTRGNQRESARQKIKSSKERNFTMEDPTPEECSSPEGKVSRDYASNNNLSLLSDTASYHEESIGSGNTIRLETGIGSGNITTSEIGIGSGNIIRLETGIGSGNITTSEIGIGSGNITTSDKGIQCEIPQLVVQNDIGCQYIEPVLQTNEPMNIQVDEHQVDLLADVPSDDLLIDSYIADITNHQTLTHKGKLFKYVLVQRDNLKVLSYDERTKLIKAWITLNIVDNRNSFYSCKIHRGGCKFVNITTRSKSKVDNHVQSYLMYMICILCKEKVLHRPGFAQHIECKHPNQ